jgi:hypothetical protein
MDCSVWGYPGIAPYGKFRSEFVVWRLPNKESNRLAIDRGSNFLALSFTLLNRPVGYSRNGRINRFCPTSEAVQQSG